jgi:hypothetical protein
VLPPVFGVFAAQPGFPGRIEFSARTGSAWTIERTTRLQRLVNGEVKTLSGRELPDVACPDSASLSAQLPTLLEELLTFAPSSAVE